VRGHNGMKKIFAYMFIVFLWTTFAWARISGDDAERGFLRAEIAYKAEQYDDAIQGYEEILRGGRESGSVYYNLGNCYFKKEDLGRAILNYERAYRLIPRDGDLRANRRYALAQVKQPAGRQFSLWGDIVRRSMQQLTVDELAWLILFFISLSAASHLSGLFLPKWRDHLRVIVMVCVASNLFLLSLLVGQMNLIQNQAVVLTEAAVRFEPRSDATVHFSLEVGQTVRILKKEEMWFKVERPDGKMGWVEQSSLEKI